MFLGLGGCALALLLSGVSSCVQKWRYSRGFGSSIMVFVLWREKRGLETLGFQEKLGLVGFQALSWNCWSMFRRCSGFEFAPAPQTFFYFQTSCALLCTSDFSSLRGFLHQHGESSGSLAVLGIRINGYILRFDRDFLVSKLEFLHCEWLEGPAGRGLLFATW